MSDPEHLDRVRDYFTEKLQTHGATHRGVDYNSTEAQETRFLQLTRAIDSSREYSLVDFGSGYGAMLDYLRRQGHCLSYVGYDIAEPMVLKGRELHPDDPGCRFTSRIAEVSIADYAVLSGTFNIKLATDQQAWTKIVLNTLHQMNDHSSRGMAFNMLTSYSDADKMRPDLYYGDPCFFFDYCMRNFSKNVALLHDYRLYDFTIIVRKD